MPQQGVCNKKSRTTGKSQRQTCLVVHKGSTRHPARKVRIQIKYCRVIFLHNFPFLATVSICGQPIFFFRFRSWLKLEGPPEVVLSGYDIRRFLSPSMLSLKLADAFVRLLRSLENETMAKRTKSPGRHYVSPQWGVSSFFVQLPCRFYLMPFLFLHNVITR